MQGNRFEQRKKQRLNRFLNIAIGLVVLLILVFGVQIILDSSSNQDAIADTSEQEQSELNTIPESNDVHEEVIANDEVEEVEEVEEELEPVPDGEWEPVGTEQTGEFTHDFSRGSRNWTEMETALKQATGLDNNMVIWRLENAGPTSARGVVSSPDSQSQPYEVIIEWIDGQGWAPVSKNQLSSNPYR